MDSIIKMGKLKPGNVISFNQARFSARVERLKPRSIMSVESLLHDGILVTDSFKSRLDAG